MATNFFDELLSNLAGAKGGGGAYGDLLNSTQQQQINQQAQLAMAAKLLQASGRSRQRISLGQALGSGLEAAQGARQAGELSAIQQMLMRQKLGETARLSGLATQAEGIMGDTQPVEGAPLSPTQAISLGTGGPTTQAAAMIGQAAPKPSMNPNEYRANQYTKLADLYAARDPEKSKLYQDLAAKFNPPEEVTGQPIEVTDTEGNRVLVQQMKSGKIQTVPGFGVKRQVELKDIGGKLVAVDMSQVTGGTEFKKTMTPSEAANLGIAQGGLNLRQLEFARGANVIKDTPEGLVYVPAAPTPGATATPVMGAGGKQVMGTSGGSLTEGERKAGTLLSRLQIADAQIAQQVGQTAPGIGSSLTPRLAKPEERKRVEDAEMEFLDAGLTLSTGAAYTKEQLQGARQSYFPQYGDDANTIAAKNARRLNLIESAKLAAGKAAALVPARSPFLDQAPAQPAPGAAPRRTLGSIFNK